MGIDDAWFLNEHKEMSEQGFSCCKVSGLKSNVIVGFVDFRADTETYLSLMMIDNKLRCGGIGKAVFGGFAEFVKGRNSQAIRIDVLAKDNEPVLKFWENCGAGLLRKKK